MPVRIVVVGKWANSTRPSGNTPEEREDQLKALVLRRAAHLANRRQREATAAFRRTRLYQLSQIGPAFFSFIGPEMATQDFHLFAQMQTPGNDDSGYAPADQEDGIVC